MSSARSTQKFGGIKEIMKRQNGVRAAYDAFLLGELQVAFGCAADFNTSNGPWPLIILCHCHLASFTETP